MKNEAQAKADGTSKVGTLEKANAAQANEIAAVRAESARKDNTLLSKDKEIESLKLKQTMAGQTQAKLKNQFVKLASLAKDFKIFHTELKDSVGVELR